MPSKQIINILGHAGRDAEFKDVGNGLTTFSVAVSDDYKDKSGEWVKNTNWYTVNIWGDTGARFVGKILKGDKVDVTGKPNARAYMGKDGEPRAELVITAFSREVLHLEKQEPKAATVAS